MSLASTLKSLRPPTKDLLSEIEAIRCRIEGRLHNPTKARIGAQYPMRTMLGPMMAKYYPAALDTSGLGRLAKSVTLGNTSGYLPWTMRDKEMVMTQMTHRYRLLKGKTKRPQPRIPDRKAGAKAKKRKR